MKEIYWIRSVFVPPTYNFPSKKIIKVQVLIISWLQAYSREVQET